MAGTTTKNDKYIVSFNSDTSDSEDSEINERLPVSENGDDGSPKNGNVTSENEQPGLYFSNPSDINEKFDCVEVSNKLVDKVSRFDKDNDIAFPKRKPMKSNQINNRMVYTDKNDFDEFDTKEYPDSFDSPFGSVGKRDVSNSEVSSNNTKLFDLDQAYSRAKNKNTLLARNTSHKAEPNLLIDFSDNSEKYATNHSKKTDVSEFDSVYNARLKSGISCDGAQNVRSTSKSETEISTSNSLRKENDTAGILENDLDFDADLLIYASPGTKLDQSCKITANETNEHVSKLNQDNKDHFDAIFRKDDTNPCEPDSIPSPKGKYRNIDEKFSAICSKYGRDRKYEKSTNKTDMFEAENTGITTGNRGIGNSNEDGQIPATPKNPGHKLTFDDMVSWDQESTDDLIKRILADARNETPVGKYKTISSNKSNDTYDSETENSHTQYTSLDKGDRKYDQVRPSLLERRLASLEGETSFSAKKPPTPVQHNQVQAYSEPGHDEFYKRRAHSSFEDAELDCNSTNRYMPRKDKLKNNYDEEEDHTVGISGRSYQKDYLRPPTQNYESDSDDDSYRSSRRRTPILPDDWFSPQKSDDTDNVVKERTYEVRNMVDNQSEVLGRLKKAAKDFDDLDAEIRALKQQCIENQVARQEIINDIIHDIKKDTLADEDSEPVRPTRGSYQRYGAVRGKLGSRTRDHNPPYIESDIVSEHLGGYALGCVAKSRYGEPGGSRAFRSASVSRFDNIEEDRYDKYGLYNTSTRGMRAGSCIDNYDRRGVNHTVDQTDESESVSVKSFSSEKGEDESDEGSARHHDQRRSKYTPYQTSRYEQHTPLAKDQRGSVRQSYTTNANDNLHDRPRIRGTSLPPPDRPFTSRFLSKIREKKASGIEVSPRKDKPFKSRFLNRSFDSDYYSGSSSGRGSLASTPDKNIYTSNSPRSYSSRSRDADVTPETSAQES